MFEGFKTRQFHHKGTKIHYLKAGEGPPILMLHGFPQNLAMWAKLAPALAENFTVICADLRGYGDSDKPKAGPRGEGYSFRDMANDNLELMKTEGFEAFNLVGHDRGARVSHRMALDHPEAVITLTVMDIVPTLAMFMDTNRHVAGAYWHWYFLSQPAPLPERLIINEPDFFYETCLFGWGSTSVKDFDKEQLADYRRCWREEGMIYGSCADYRAAANIDILDDQADQDVKLTCPVLNLYGADGTMAQLFDMPGEWQKRCASVLSKAIPGGHFFVDTAPEETLETLKAFLSENA